MKKNNIPTILFCVLLLAIFALYIWIRVDNSQYIRGPRASFGDSHEYFSVASQSIFSKSFWIAIRPPVIPLIYKILSGNPGKIISFQLWFSILSWAILALVVQGVFSNKLVRILATIIVLAFSLSEEIIMWDSLILSESISISITALFFSSITLLLKKWTWSKVVTVIVSAFLLAMTRDAFAYFILFSGLAALVLIPATKQYKPILMISTSFILIFLGSNYLATTSLRWYPSLLNVIGIRILPNPQYVGYFEQRGMPVSEALINRSGKFHHYDYEELDNNLELREFSMWVKESGRNEYLRFLWFYKADATQNVFNDKEHLLNPDLYYYTATGFRKIVNDSRIDELLYPNRYSLVLFLIGNMMAASFGVWALYERKLLWLLPVVLIILTYPQMILIWNADTYEIGRHSIHHNIQLRLGIILTILFSLDFVIDILKSVYSPNNQLSKT